jgi:hypothetical protein
MIMTRESDGIASGCFLCRPWPSLAKLERTGKLGATARQIKERPLKFQNFNNQEGPDLSLVV